MSRKDAFVYGQIWAPWRLSYIKGEEDPDAKDEIETAIPLSPGVDEPCFICRGLADDDDRRNLIVQRGAKTAVILNRYPYNNGHLLIAPQAHKGRLEELADDEHLELQQSIARMAGLLEGRLHAEGFNIGLNLGRVAGAGLPGHLHWHIVPRWNGDTNFMPSLAGVKVIPQSLEALWELLNQ